MHKKSRQKAALFVQVSPVGTMFILFIVVWPTARPSDLFGEGRRVGVFVIFNGSGTILAFIDKVDEHRDEFVLALCLNGETIIGVIDNDPAVVETCIKAYVA